MWKSFLNCSVIGLDVCDCVWTIKYMKLEVKGTVLRLHPHTYIFAFFRFHTQRTAAQQQHICVSMHVYISALYIPRVYLFQCTAVWLDICWSFRKRANERTNEQTTKNSLFMLKTVCDSISLAYVEYILYIASVVCTVHKYT